MRKLALLTGVFTALNLVKPLSNLIVSIRQMPPTTIWRNMATQVSRQLRFLGRAAALVQGIILAAELPARLSALLNDWAVTRKLDWWNGAAVMWNAARDPFTIACATNAFDLLLSVFSIALLIALSRDPSDEPSEDIQVGRLLREVSAMTVIALGLVLVFQLIGIVLVPRNYALLKDYAYQLGRTPPRLLDLFTYAIRMLVSEACLFVAPFLVYSASRDVMIEFA